MNRGNGVYILEKNGASSVCKALNYKAKILKMWEDRILQHLQRASVLLSGFYAWSMYSTGMCW